MSLGVLNNLNAVYAENNLNNSSNSLSKVLQQLSSGSKINSGADDAAGLSLVNGLQANQTALTQSVTNAKEGVGLLQVADGALSQVTSLLNRAVTLATEASNGTLNSSQDMAANQEYQSILSEISNIGSTTTYNGQQVFNTKTDIYTGDSSAAGSSIDRLNISALSSSNLGDTGGVMAYSNGQNNVFINLSGAHQNAQATDSLNTNGTTTINVNYLVKGANGSENTASSSISVGNGTKYGNTVNGLISAINDAGLGLNASFSTQAQAGITGGGSQTGIQISGGLVSVGVDPGASTTGGTLNPSDIANGDLTQGQTITVKVGNTTVANVVISSTNNKLQDVADAINNSANNTVNATPSSLVTATVIKDGNGNATSIQLNDSASTGGALSVTSTPSNLVANQLTSLTTVQSANDPKSMVLSSSAAGVTGKDAQATLGISGTNTASQVLSGSIVLSNNATPGTSPVTFVMGQASASGSAATGTVNLASTASTLQDLATAIQSNLGVNTTVGSNGITMTSATTGTTIGSVGTPTLSALVAVGNTVAQGSPVTSGTPGTMTIALNGDGGTLAATDVLTQGTSLVLQNGNVGTPGSAVTFVVGAGGGVMTSGTVASGTITLGNAGTVKVSDLVAAITANNAALGYGASAATGNLVLTANGNGTSISMGASTNLADKSEGIGQGGFNTATTAIAGGLGTAGTATLLSGLTSAGGDALTGTVALTNTANNTVQTFVMGGVAGNANGTITVGGGASSTLTNLMAAINTDSVLGITATMDSTGGNGGIDLATTAGNRGSITINTFATTHAFSDNYSVGVVGGVNAITQGALQYNTAILAPLNGTSGIPTSVAAGVTAGALTGSIVITNNGKTDTFVMNSAAADTSLAGGGNTLNVTTANSTLTGLANAINAWKAAGTDSLDLTASVDAGTGGLVLQSSLDVTAGGAMTIGTNTLSDTVAVANVSSAGVAATNAASASVTVVQGTVANTAGGGTINANDTLTSGNSLVLHVNATDKTFTMGTGTNTANQFFTGTGNLKVSDLMNTINDNSANGLGLQAQIASGNGGIKVNYLSSANQTALTITSSTLEDSFKVNAATAANGTTGSAATGASATVGTTGTIGANDIIGGSIVISNGGAAQTFTMANLGATTQNMDALKDAINNNTALGVVAQFNNGALHLQSSATGTTMTVNSSALTDTTGASVGSATAGTPDQFSKATLTITSSNPVATNDVVTGNIVLSGNGATNTFVMGGTTDAANHIIGVGSAAVAGSETVNALETAINGSGMNLHATHTGSDQKLVITSTVANTTQVTGTSNLNDAFSTPSATASLGKYQSASDAVSGTVNFNVGGVQAANFTIGANQTIQDVVNTINGGANSFSDPYHVHASISAPDAHGFVSVTLASDIYGASGDIANVGTLIDDNGASSALNYTPSTGYNIGISNVAGSGVYDASTQSAPTGAYSNLTATSGGSGGIATMSYSDGAGVSLSATDLSNQTDAQSALTSLNGAITAVAAQDGYIGAQINTLNAVSQVLTTQQENVQAAQNAIQATDYASATSNMSKYEILSQTGIAALAQANSIQQEVTKLLQ